MKFSWIIIFVLLASLVSATEQYYQAEILYSNGSYTLQDLDVIPLTADPGFESGDIVVALLDSDKKVMDLRIFPFSDKIYVFYEEDREEVITQDEFEFTVYVPYFENAATLVVYDENLTSLIRHSFDDGLTNEVVEDIEEIEVVDTKKNFTMLIIFISAMILLFIILFIVFFVRRKSS